MRISIFDLMSLLYSSLAGAQSTSTIVGKLYVEMESYLFHIREDIDLELLDMNGNIVARTTTEFLGAYNFWNVAPGLYKTCWQEQHGWNADCGDRTVEVVGGKEYTNDYLIYLTPKITLDQDGHLIKGAIWGCVNFYDSKPAYEYGYVSEVRVLDHLNQVLID